MHRTRRGIFLLGAGMAAMVALLVIVMALGSGSGGSGTVLANNPVPPVCPIVPDLPFPDPGCDEEYSVAVHGVKLTNPVQVGPLTCTGGGTTLITRSAVGDSKSKDPAATPPKPTPGPDGLDDIQTEIIHMKLVGKCQPGNIPFTMTESAKFASTGFIQEKVNNIPGVLEFPAASFFDVYVDIKTPLGTFHNQDPVQMFCQIGAVPPLGCEYAAKNLPVQLHDGDPNDPQKKKVGSIIGPATHTLHDKDAWDGDLSGDSDILVHLGAKAVGLFTCINRTDHDTVTNDVVTAAVCASDSETGDPNGALFGINPPGEGPDMVPGPPPPPGYSNLPINNGGGKFLKNGSGDYNGFSCETSGVDCLITITCFPRLGGGPLGPNTVAVLKIENPKEQMKSIGKQQGTVLIYSGVSNDTCNNYTPDPGDPPAGLPINVSPADDTDPLCAPGCDVAPWRDPNQRAGDGKVDYDGDGCSDYQELAITPDKGCGDDPWNPYDSNATDLSGSYSILTEALQADLGVPGIYFHCLADMQQEDKVAAFRMYCYVDAPFMVVNPEVAGDNDGDTNPDTTCPPAPDAACGDGFPGAAPPFPYGDMDDAHNELSGVIDWDSNTITLSGCFEDRDDMDTMGDVYVVAVWNLYLLSGDADIWANASEAECDSPTPPAGAPSFAGAHIMGARQEPGPKANGDRDTDQDGCSDKDELQDDDPLEPVPGKSGELRDPYNRWDYYDAGGPGNGPPDGVIDLANDILGVILRYTANPTLPYDANYDRPAVTAGSANHWNRGSPDGPIDLPNDILGVILQYQHCPDVPSN